MNFIKAYIKSMRLYYSFITGIAGWVGVAHYEHIVKEFRTVEVMPSVERKGVILILLFLSWGINQIFNDFLGRKEDAINAPNRPMITGELNPMGALALSTFLMAGAAIITAIYLEPIAILPLLFGVVLNIIYEYAKGYGIWGNIIFGLMITQCTAFGFLASGPTQAPYFTKSRIAVLGVVWLMNGLMTFYTYFKDYEGDKAAGKKTLVVKYGLNKSRFIAIFSSILPGTLFLTLYFTNQIIARVNTIFIILGLITIFLEVLTGWFYFKSPRGKVTYYALATNFRACACGQATFIALNNTELAMVLFLVSYVFVGFLFNLHSDVKV